MPKLTKEQLAGVLGVLSGSLIKTAAVKLIESHINELEGDITIRDISMKRMQEQIDRLQDNVVQLTAECRRLEAEVDEAREAKKVVVPQGMADAIEFLRSQKNGHTLAYHLDWVVDMSKSHSELKDLPEHMFLKGYNTYFRALIEGYTVEEPPTAEERMRVKVDALLDEHDIISPIPRERLVELLTLAAREAVAESTQAESQ